VQIDRRTAAFGELVLGMSLELGAGAYATLDSALQPYALPMFDAETRRTETRAALTSRLALGGGLRF
jgi:type IV secretory pathway TraG/TraD family ATPase VirD4